MSSSTSKHTIKGMIALSISPFLVVDDNIHITPKGMHILVVMGTSRIMNSPSMCAYKILQTIRKMYTLRWVPPQRLLINIFIPYVIALWTCVVWLRLDKCFDPYYCAWCVNVSWLCMSYVVISCLLSRLVLFIYCKPQMIWHMEWKFWLIIIVMGLISMCTSQLFYQDLICTHWGGVHNKTCSH